LQTARANLEKVAFFMSVNCPKDAGLPLEPETKEKTVLKGQENRQLISMNSQKRK
jgi:hypothetical protein